MNAPIEKKQSLSVLVWVIMLEKNSVIDIFFVRFCLFFLFLNWSFSTDLLCPNGRI